MSVIRVMIVDNHAMTRRSIRVILKNAPDIHVVGEASSGEFALSRVVELQPDLILMDVAMSKMDGLTATQQLQNLPHPPYVLIFSIYADVSMAIKAFQWGARGVLLKTHPHDELLMAIRYVMEGKRVVSAELQRQPSAQQLDGDILSISG
jgi:two-component system response regulator NreC